MAEAYCVKCRKKVEMQNAEQITMKNGKPATRGICPICGTKVFRIGKAAQLDLFVFDIKISSLKPGDIFNIFQADNSQLLLEIARQSFIIPCLATSSHSIGDRISDLNHC